jgi:hypothetical protein
MPEFTEPKTVVEGSAALSSDWNTFVRDNTKFLKERIQILTQAEYDELEADSGTIYFVVED